MSCQHNTSTSFSATHLNPSQTWNLPLHHLRQYACVSTVFLRRYTSQEVDETFHQLTPFKVNWNQKAQLIVQPKQLSQPFHTLLDLIHDQSDLNLRTLPFRQDLWQPYFHKIWYFNYRLFARRHRQNIETEKRKTTAETKAWLPAEMTRNASNCRPTNSQGWNHSRSQNAQTAIAWAMAGSCLLKLGEWRDGWEGDKGAIRQGSSEQRVLG